MLPYAANVRRLMARGGLTLEQLMAATGLHERTLKGILNGRSKPHARTLHRLAAGLGVAADELFQSPAVLAHRAFDRQAVCAQHPATAFDRLTNPAVQEVVESQPELFDGWTETDFEELYSHFGTGGALSPDGAAQVVLAMNEKRAVHQKVALLLESGEAALLAGFVELLYQKIAVTRL